MDISRLEGLKEALVRVMKRAKQAGMDVHFISEVDHLLSTVNANIETCEN